jgi:hypothetical protein
MAAEGLGAPIGRTGETGGRVAARDGVAGGDECPVTTAVMDVQGLAVGGEGQRRNAKQVASGLGSFAYIFGIRPQPYRKVDGA